jgi:hypothetical protein
METNERPVTLPQGDDSPKDHQDDNGPPPQDGRPSDHSKDKKKEI